MKAIIKKLLLSKFNKFVIGGFLNFGIKLGVTFLLTELIQIWYFASYIISLAIVISFSFFYNAYITFKVTRNKKLNFIKYCIALLAISIIDAAAVKLLTDMIGLYYLASIFSVTIVLFLTKFIVYDKLVFVDAVKKKNIPGNFYNKYESKNFLIRLLMRRYDNMLFRLVAKIKPKSILDVGCGEGYVTSKIKNKFKETKVEGSDLEKNVLKKARKDFRNIKFSVESAYSLKRKSNSFDLVTALEVLEHLEKPEKAIKEAKRVSKKYCIFSVPYEPFWRIANMIRLAYLPQLGNTPGHIQHWTKSSFRKMLENHFKNVKIKNCLLWNFALCWG